MRRAESAVALLQAVAAAAHCAAPHLGGCTLCSTKFGRPHNPALLAWGPAPVCRQRPVCQQRNYYGPTAAGVIWALAGGAGRWAAAGCPDRTHQGARAWVLGADLGACTARARARPRGGRAGGAQGCLPGWVPPRYHLLARLHVGAWRPGAAGRHPATCTCVTGTRRVAPGCGGLPTLP